MPMSWYCGHQRNSRYRTTRWKMKQMMAKKRMERMTMVTRKGKRMRIWTMRRTRAGRVKKCRDLGKRDRK